MRLHVIVFESKTGDVDAKSYWATPDPGDGVIAAYNGKVVIRCAHKLTLYNTKLEALKETDMAPAFVALSSLTGHFLLLGSSKSHDAEQSREFSWMNAETLETVHSFSDALSPVSISDTEIGLWRRLRPPEVEFVIRKPDEPGRVITVPGHGWLRVVFVDQDTLATEAGYFPITLVRTDGTLVETVTPNTHGLFSRVTPSAEGHRFAFTGSIIRNRSEIFSPNRPWEYVQRIHVYDMSTHSFVGDVKVHHSAKDQEFPLALSPNGSMLAFLDGKSLTVYRLP